MARLVTVWPSKTPVLGRSEVSFHFWPLPRRRRKGKETSPIPCQHQMPAGSGGAWEHKEWGLPKVGCHWRLMRGEQWVGLSCPWSQMECQTGKSRQALFLEKTQSIFLAKGTSSFFLQKQQLTLTLKPTTSAWEFSRPWPLPHHVGMLLEECGAATEETLVFQIPGCHTGALFH